MFLKESTEVITSEVNSVQDRVKSLSATKVTVDDMEVELDLLVDMLRQQSGNTNDSNTARKSSRNAEKSVEIMS
ncbi:hypothetical protein ILUMI_16032 [Ignelater luminosus]|uniref:Uncharacterized protein n=1 Tax=Ignelater luminosus TaxID=2038154 RepID=A0A8K0CRZ2_IGNLU|nr:hypothetical protein ILUMI_16032 [Ignelater luminosus]